MLTTILKVLLKPKHKTRSKLNASDVRQIKQLLAARHTLKSIGRKYHVTAPAIHAIKTGKTWRHI